MQCRLVDISMYKYSVQPGRKDHHIPLHNSAQSERVHSERALLATPRTNKIRMKTDVTTITAKKLRTNF